jgi:hypothetical protein
MDTLLYIGGGAAFSLGFIALARTWGRQREILLYGVALGLTAGIYVVFAGIARAGSAVPVELLGLALFGGLGALGAWRWPTLLAAGWAGHVAWDLLVADASATGYAPTWYPTLCIGADLFLAGYITELVWSGRANSDSSRLTA